MPISEILDRYTISKLKSERTSENVSEELQAYRAEIDKYDIDLSEYVNRLYEINGKLWNTEAAIRNRENLPLEKVGELAIKVRDLNCARNAVKAELVDKFSEGFKEIKINYKKVDYGKQ